MNKILAALGKAGMAGMVGYEVGQITKETQVVHVDMPIQNTTPEIYTNMPEKESIKEILLLIVFLLLIVIAFIISRYLRCKTEKRANSIEI